jgi:hypothetical protein
MTIALAAIIISAVALAWTAVWSIYTYRRGTKPSISARAAWSYPVYDLPGGRHHLGDATVSINATNTGPVAVTISGVKFFIRGKSKATSVVPIDWVVQSPRSLPVLLNPGDHWSGLVHAGSVKASIDRSLGPRRRWHVSPVVSDTADRRYRAVIYRFGWRRFLPGRRRWLELEHDRV